MPEFPRRKNDILVQAAKMVRGFVDYAADYPNPPFDGGPLATIVSSAVNLIGDRQTKEAAYQDALELENDKIYHEAVPEMRHLERLARDRYGDDPAKLAEIGLEPKADRRFLAPGIVRGLEVAHQGAGTVEIDWKAPARTAATGDPKVYKITRETRNPEPPNEAIEAFGTWQTIEFTTKAIILNQPRGVEIRYRVIASNNNGDGPPMDAERIVL